MLETVLTNSALRCSSVFCSTYNYKIKKKHRCAGNKHWNDRSCMTYKSVSKWAVIALMFIVHNHLYSNSYCCITTTNLSMFSLIYSAIDMALPAFTAERWAAEGGLRRWCCWAPAKVDHHLLPTRRSAANPPHAAAAVFLTDGHPTVIQTLFRILCAQCQQRYTKVQHNNEKK